MRYIFIFSLTILSVCANATDNIKSLDSSNVDFDVSAGKYEKFKLNSWKVGSNECVEFELKKPYNTTNWLATLTLQFTGDSKKEVSEIMLFTEKRESQSLTLAYLGSDKEYRLIKQNINFGESVKFNVLFTNNRTVGVKLAYSEFSFPLKFKINSIVVGASSSQATVKLLEKSECINQK